MLAAYLMTGEHTWAYQVLAWQRELHRGLTQAITQLSSAPSLAAWNGLLGVSFAYGVFHAAGPGHGKAVLATYLVSQGGALRRALALSFAAALLQGVSAITLVVALVHGLGWLTRQAMGSVAWVEQGSFLLVTALGVWLCWRAVRQLRRAYALYHDHDHDHDHTDCCGAHHIEPHQTRDWRTAVVAVVAIGLRPCSGAVLLLGAATLLGQFSAGVVAVLVMSLGTALTVSMLALASVVARDWAQRRLARQTGARRLQLVAGGMALGGGVAIIVLGITLSVAGVAKPDRDSLLTPMRPASVIS
ncbi:nickel/cobalt transporter [Halomonas sp. Bachu 37]|uniref:nickel/cobalt transporter n=1 Tax=Halomonas kashgarensis TaxID=3084920 RepID=UPI003216B6E7